MLSFHRESKEDALRKTCDQESWLYFVVDGAVVSRLDLEVPGGVSCALFVSGEGLTGDLSGFGFVHDEAWNRRCRTARQLATGLIEQAHLPVSGSGQSLRPALRQVGRLCVAGGVVLAFAFPGWDWEWPVWEWPAWFRLPMFWAGR